MKLPSILRERPRIRGLVDIVRLAACHRHVRLGWSVLHRKVEQDFVRKVVAMVTTTGAALLAVGEIAYVHLVRDLSWQEGGQVWGWILLLSLLGFITGLFTLRAPRWFSVLTLATSSWMLVVSFLSGMSI